jgi:hypothetical protein
MTEFEFNQFEKLKAALVEAEGARPPVPSEIDRQILAKARQSYVARRRTWAVLQRTGTGLAAAAVIAIAVRVFWPGVRPTTTAPAQRPQLAQAADINRDGRVDILDAYVVARHIARHEPLDPAWDVNGDGIVDQKDVDLIAHLAVRADAGKAQ